MCVYFLYFSICLINELKSNDKLKFLDTSEKGTHLVLVKDEEEKSDIYSSVDDVNLKPESPIIEEEKPNPYSGNIFFLI